MRNDFRLAALPYRLDRWSAAEMILLLSQLAQTGQVANSPGVSKSSYYGWCADWDLQCCRHFSIPPPQVLWLDTVLSWKSTDNSSDLSCTVIKGTLYRQVCVRVQLSSVFGVMQELHFWILSKLFPLCCYWIMYVEFWVEKWIYIYILQ